MTAEAYYILIGALGVGAMATMAWWLHTLHKMVDELTDEIQTLRRHLALFSVEDLHFGC